MPQENASPRMPRNRPARRFGIGDPAAGGGEVEASCPHLCFVHRAHPPFEPSASSEVSGYGTRLNGACRARARRAPSARSRKRMRPRHVRCAAHRASLHAEQLFEAVVVPLWRVGSTSSTVVPTPASCRRWAGARSADRAHRRRAAPGGGGDATAKIRASSPITHFVIVPGSDWGRVAWPRVARRSGLPVAGRCGGGGDISIRDVGHS